MPDIDMNPGSASRGARASGRPRADVSRPTGKPPAAVAGMVVFLSRMVDRGQTADLAGISMLQIRSRWRVSADA
jgi:hypothetical protein